MLQYGLVDVLSYLISLILSKPFVTQILALWLFTVLLQIRQEAHLQIHAHLIIWVVFISSRSSQRRPSTNDAWKSQWTILQSSPPQHQPYPHLSYYAPRNLFHLWFQYFRLSLIATGISIPPPIGGQPFPFSVALSATSPMPYPKPAPAQAKLRTGPRSETRGTITAIDNMVLLHTLNGCETTSFREHTCK